MDKLPKTSKAVYHTSHGIRIKRAAERGLLHLLDKPEELRAELLRRLAEPPKPK